MKTLFALALLVFSIQVCALSDDEVRDIIVKQSQQSYSGNCLCPENRDRAGRRCGRRSAYSRPGGAAPLCYRTDVTPEMIEKYKKQHEKS
jgi:hypothetical protein